MKLYGSRRRTTCGAVLPSPCIWVSRSSCSTFSRSRRRRARRTSPPVPRGGYPVLVDGASSLTESHAITLYFAGLKPNTLWPRMNCNARR